MTTALTRPTASLVDVTPQVPPQQEQILAQLPQMHPEVRAILKAIKEASQQAERAHHPKMVGHGLHGEYSQVVENVDPSLIWEPDTYIRRELDEEMDLPQELDALGDPIPNRFTSMLKAATRDEITNASTGYVQMDEFDIVIVVDRKEEPNNPHSPTMMLLKGRPAWKLAQQRNRKLRVVVLPDIPDYHLRDIGLRLALRESAVEPWQVIYHLQMMVEDLKAGRCAKTALIDQPLKGKDIAEIVGVNPSWVSRIKQAIFNPIAHAYIVSRQVTPMIAYDIVSGTRGDDTLCAQILEEAATKHLEQSQVRARIHELTRPILTLPSRPTPTFQRPEPPPLPPPDPYEGGNLHEQTSHEGILAFTSESANPQSPFAQVTTPVDRLRQHVLQALREIENQREWFEDQLGLQEEDIAAGIEALEGVLLIFPSRPIG